MNKKWILLFIKVPPPITGATIMNKRIFDSKVLRNSFNIRSICISYMDHLSEMGKWKISKLGKIASVFLRLTSELNTRKISLVYFQISIHRMAFFRDLIFVTIIKLFNVNILFHLRAKGIKDKGFILRNLFKYVFKNESIICLSNHLKKDIESVYNHEVFVVNNGIPDESCINWNRYNKNSQIKLLFLSNLMEAKGIYDFIDVISILKKRGIKFLSYIVGEEHDVSEDEINHIINQKKINNIVDYLGPLYGINKFQIYSDCDILIYPTHDDAFPGVIIEALMMGTCIVATNEGAIPEMIDDGINGFIVKKRSPYQIAKKVEILINNEELRERFMNSARKKYEDNFTIEVFENKMKNVFEKCLYNHN